MCVLEVTRVCVISSDIPPTAPPPLSIYLCLRLPAWLLGSFEASCLFLGNNFGWQAMAWDGRTSKGANAPSPCPHFLGHKWSPVPQSSSTTSSYSPFFSASLFQFCWAHALRARSFNLAQRPPLRLVNQLLLRSQGEISGREGHCFGVNIAPGSNRCLSAMHLKCNGDRCRCYRNAKCEREGHCFEGFPSFSSPTARNIFLMCFWFCISERDGVLCLYIEAAVAQQV